MCNFNIHAYTLPRPTDIDECTNGTDDCQQTCMNTPGSFVCGCFDGFTLDGNGQNCTGTVWVCNLSSIVCSCGSDSVHVVFTVCWQPCTCSYTLYFLSPADIDECSDETDNCEQTCTNTPGSFVCGCFDGFTLDGNGQNCTGTVWVCNLSSIVCSCGSDSVHVVFTVCWQPCTCSYTLYFLSSCRHWWVLRWHRQLWTDLHKHTWLLCVWLFQWVLTGCQWSELHR